MIKCLKWKRLTSALWEREHNIRGGEGRGAPRSDRRHLFEHIKMLQLGYQQVTNR